MCPQFVFVFAFEFAFAYVQISFVFLFLFFFMQEVISNSVHVRSDHDGSPPSHVSSNNEWTADVQRPLFIGNV